RANSTADRLSEHTGIAADSLEAALYQLRQRSIPSQFCQTDLRYGDRLSRQVDISAPWLSVVTIRVIPNPDSPNPPPDEYVIASSIFRPDSVTGGPTGDPCR